MSRNAETATVAAVLQYLALRGVYAWRNNSGAHVVDATATTARKFIRFGFRGSSDILGIDDRGRLWAVEVKNTGGKLSAYQKAFLEEIQRRGGVGVCVYPDDFVEVIDQRILQSEAAAAKQ